MWLSCKGHVTITQESCDIAKQAQYICFSPTVEYFTASCIKETSYSFPYLSNKSTLTSMSWFCPIINSDNHKQLTQEMKENQAIRLLMFCLMIMHGCIFFSKTLAFVHPSYICTWASLAHSDTSFACNAVFLYQHFPFIFSTLPVKAAIYVCV